MRLTAVMMQKISLSCLVIFLAFSGSALARTEAVENFTPVTAEGFSWTKACGANDTSLYPHALNFRETAAESSSEETNGRSSGFYLMADPATEQDADLRFVDYIAQISDDQNLVLAGQLAERENAPTQYDLFRNEDKGFKTKLLRAGLITHTAQVINLVLMIQFPDHFNFSISSWDEARYNLHRAWTSPPVWDKDPWTTNFIGHPYVGSFYYNALRSQGSSARTSFIYSTAQSLLWEFVIEALAEQPSIQDLLFTSTIGSVMGEFSHRATIHMGRNGFSTFEKILVTILNPVYVINNGYKKHHRPPAPIF